MNRRKAKQIAEEAERLSKQSTAEKQFEEETKVQGSKVREESIQILNAYMKLVPMTELVQEALKVCVACTASIDYHMGIKK